MENTIHIREVQPHELHILRQLSMKTFLDTYGDQNTPEDISLYVRQHFSLTSLKDQLFKVDSRFFFAIENGQVLGYLKTNTGQEQTEDQSDDALEIERIYVLSDHQGKRIGAQLIEKAVKVARQQQKKTVWLGVWEKNEKAIEFYLKQGFEQYGSHTFRLGSDEQTDFMLKLEVKP